MLEAATASGGRTAIPSNVPKPAAQSEAEKSTQTRGPKRRDAFEPGEKGEKSAQAYGPAEKSGEGEADGMRGLMEEIRRELSRQQAEWVQRLLESLREKPENGSEKEGVSLRRLLERAGLEDPEQSVENAKNAPTPGLPGLDPYWNAENTSDRIVAFAMSYAGAFADVPDEFAASIFGAVEEGFRQAQAITGELPGAAGNLQKETYRLTLEKLAQRLDTWKATLYNEPAQASAGP